MSKKARDIWITLALVAGIAAIMIGSFLLAGAPTTEGEAFGGTDAAVTSLLEQQGVKPWFAPVVKLGSGEIESGLFALQAALGAGVLGYVLGNLRGRKAARNNPANEA